MIRLLGAKKKLCNGVSRRDLLQIGGLGAFGLTLEGLLRCQEAQAAPASSARGSLGKAKSCILLYLFGGASQLETWDPKPDALAEYRGELGSIPTIIPGVRIGELLPRTAKILDLTTVVRSMQHDLPIHPVGYVLTGIPASDWSIPLGANARDPKHWPFVGSVVDYLDQKRAAKSTPEIPRNVALPFLISSRSKRTGPIAGPHGHFLGTAYDPVWTQFDGQPTETARKVYDFLDPYLGIRPDGRFTVGGDPLPVEVPADRLNQRTSLLQQFEAARRNLDGPAQQFDRHRAAAHAMLTSGKMAEALDLRRESPRLRDSYGMTLFGQAALTARRLVEAGSRFVSVFWDEYGLDGTAWDTHDNHYPRMKSILCPGFDLAFSGLIRDLEARGLLDETLVVCISEHGRTPRLSAAVGGGREHWSRAYSAIFAGGGMAPGKVVGKTDKVAGEVIDTPISPKDVLATIYHLMGIDPETTIPDRLGRPVAIAGDGIVRRELLT